MTQVDASSEKCDDCKAKFWDRLQKSHTDMKCFDSFHAKYHEGKCGSRNVFAKIIIDKVQTLFMKDFYPVLTRYKRVIARLSILLSKWSESYTREKSAKIPVICLIKLKLEEIVFAPYRVECYRLSSKQRGLPKIAEHQWLEAVRASAGRRSRNLNLLPPLAK